MSAVRFVQTLLLYSSVGTDFRACTLISLTGQQGLHTGQGVLIDFFSPTACPTGRLPHAVDQYYELSTRRVACTYSSVCAKVRLLLYGCPTFLITATSGVRVPELSAAAHHIQKSIGFSPRRPPPELIRMKTSTFPGSVSPAPSMKRAPYMFALHPFFFPDRPIRPLLLPPAYSPIHTNNG